jgi:hypothetical protein
MNCTKFVVALFGFFFLLALFFVPVTTTTSSLRTDPNSLVVIRTTYPRNSTIFLPQYLSMKTHPREGRTVHVRFVHWLAYMALIAVMGIFDYAVFCRLLKRRRRPAEEAGPDEEESGSPGDSSSSLSLFR